MTLPPSGPSYGWGSLSRDTAQSSVTPRVFAGQWRLSASHAAYLTKAVRPVPSRSTPGHGRPADRDLAAAGMGTCWWRRKHMSGPCSRSKSRPSRSAWPFLVALIVAVTLPVSACSPPGGPAPARSATAVAPTRPAKVVVPPDTSAGAQLRWLLAAMAHPPVSDGQVRAHFDAAFLAQVSPAVLNQALQALTGAELLSVQVSELNTVLAIVSARGAAAPAQIWLTVDRRGLISELRISPVTTGPTPGTWASMSSTRWAMPWYRARSAGTSR